MASLAARNLRIGRVIDRTFGVAEQCLVPALIYIAAFTAAYSVAGYFMIGVTGISLQASVGLLKFVAQVIGGYLLLKTMLRKTGLYVETGKELFLPFCGLLILSTLGVLAGFILIVLPGIYIMGRWSISQALLVGRGAGVRQALGESWERTKENDWQLFVIMLLIVIVSALSAIPTLVLGNDDVVGIVIAQLLTSATAVLSVSLGVALFDIIVGKPAAETFA
jgi:hypothetical protein